MMRMCRVTRLKLYRTSSRFCSGSANKGWVTGISHCYPNESGDLKYLTLGCVYCWEVTYAGNWWIINVGSDGLRWLVGNGLGMFDNHLGWPSWAHCSNCSYLSRISSYVLAVLCPLINPIWYSNINEVHVEYGSSFVVLVKQTSTDDVFLIYKKRHALFLTSAETLL